MGSRATRIGGHMVWTMPQYCSSAKLAPVSGWRDLTYVCYSASGGKSMMCVLPSLAVAAIRRPSGK
jgi:hypothetical protein